MYSFVLVHSAELPWGYDSVSERFRSWYYVIPGNDKNGTAKKDPMNGGAYVTSESCFPQFTPYHARKMQRWAMGAPELLPADAVRPVAPPACARITTAASGVTETLMLSSSAWTSEASFTVTDSSAYFLASDGGAGPTSRTWWGGSSTTLTVPLHSTCDPSGATVEATFVAQQTACGSTWQMNAGRSAGNCDHQLVLTLDSSAGVNTWRSDAALASCELYSNIVHLEARKWHDPNAESLLGDLTLQVIVVATDCAPDESWVAPAGAYAWDEATHQYEGPMSAAAIQSSWPGQAPVEVGVPTLTLLGTLASNSEACQTYPPTFTSAGNTFVSPNPFLSENLPSAYDNAAHYIKVTFEDGSIELALIAVGHFVSSDTSLTFYAINVALSRRPVSVHLYRTISATWPDINESSEVTLLHTRAIDPDHGGTPLPSVVRVGRGWLGAAAAQALELNSACISGSTEQYSCATLAKTIRWRDIESMLVKTYQAQHVDASFSSGSSTALRINVTREVDSTEHQLIVMASRFYDESDGREFALIGTVQGAPTGSNGLLDATQGVRFWVPHEVNSDVLSPGGVFRSTSALTVEVNDQSWRVAVTVNINVRAITEVISLPRIGSVTWTSEASFTVTDSSAYFLASDGGVGPTSRTWWGGSSTTLTVPLHSSCDPSGATVEATFVAQQTACGSTWQMNAGRSAGNCDHQLVLTLDSSAGANTWRSDAALASCELRTQAGVPVVIKARKWHDPNAESLLGELVLQVVSAATSRSKKVFCHYLPWFTIEPTPDYNQARRGWCATGAAGGAQCVDPSLRQYTGSGPLIGEYSQREAHVLEYHLLLAHAAGIDAFIVNVNPTSALQVEVAAALFTAAARLRQQHGPSKFGLKLAISYDNAQATTQDLVDADFAVLTSLLAPYSARSVALEDETSGGRLLLLWSENAPDMVHIAANEMLGSNSVVLARNPRSFDKSDGNFAWVLPMQSATASELASNWGNQYLKDFEWAMAQQDPSDANTLALGAVYPGFDDSEVPVEWNGGTARQISREVASGVTYDLTWEFALSYVPQRYGGPTAAEMPWVQIVTWNDFPEGTAIEPSEGSGGTAAFNATFEFARRWHGSSTSTVGQDTATQAVDAATTILNARRTQDARAIIAVAHFIDGDFNSALNALSSEPSSTPTLEPISIGKYSIFKCFPFDGSIKLFKFTGCVGGDTVDSTATNLTSDSSGATKWCSLDASGAVQMICQSDGDGRSYKHHCGEISTNTITNIPAQQVPESFRWQNGGTPAWTSGFDNNACEGLPDANQPQLLFEPEWDENGLCEAISDSFQAAGCCTFGQNSECANVRNDFKFKGCCASSSSPRTHTKVWTFAT